MLENCSKNTHSGLTIGPLTFRNRALLAPMSGVSDVPFRQLAWEFGAGMVVSEMVASEALTTGQEEMRLKAEAAGLPTHIVQLAGRQPHWMAEATRMAEQSGAHAIDINMGCPSKRVTNGYSGSALMRDLDHAMTLIEAVMSATDLPVTRGAPLSSRRQGQARGPGRGRLRARRPFGGILGGFFPTRLEILLRC